MNRSEKVTPIALETHLMIVFFIGHNLIFLTIALLRIIMLTSSVNVHDIKCKCEVDKRTIIPEICWLSDKMLVLKFELGKSDINLFN